MVELCTHQNLDWGLQDVESHSSDRITIHGVCIDCNDSVVISAEIKSVSELRHA
jgi:hypothetical protein